MEFTTAPRAAPPVIVKCEISQRNKYGSVKLFRTNKQEIYVLFVEFLVGSAERILLQEALTR